MKVLLFVALLITLVSSPAMARLQAALVSSSKTVASSATPEAVVASMTFTENVTIQAKSTNTGSIFIGPCTGSQDVEITPGGSIGFADLSYNNVEIAIDLNKICIDVAVNGEGANVLYTKTVTQ